MCGRVPADGFRSGGRVRVDESHDVVLVEVAEQTADAGACFDDNVFTGLQGSVFREHCDRESNFECPALVGHSAHTGVCDGVVDGGFLTDHVDCTVVLYAPGVEDRTGGSVNGFENVVDVQGNLEAVAVVRTFRGGVEHGVGHIAGDVEIVSIPCAVEFDGVGCGNFADPAACSRVGRVDHECGIRIFAGIDHAVHGGSCEGNLYFADRCETGRCGSFCCRAACCGSAVEFDGVDVTGLQRAVVHAGGSVEVEGMLACVHGEGCGNPLTFRTFNEVHEDTVFAVRVVDRIVKTTVGTGTCDVANVEGNVGAFGNFKVVPRGGISLEAVGRTAGSEVHEVHADAALCVIAGNFVHVSGSVEEFFAGHFRVFGVGGNSACCRSCCRIACGRVDELVEVEGLHVRVVEVVAEREGEGVFALFEVHRRAGQELFGVLVFVCIVIADVDGFGAVDRERGGTRNGLLPCHQHEADVVIAGFFDVKRDFEVSEALRLQENIAGGVNAVRAGGAAIGIGVAHVPEFQFNGVVLDVPCGSFVELVGDVLRDPFRSTYGQRENGYEKHRQTEFQQIFHSASPFCMKFKK